MKLNPKIITVMKHQQCQHNYLLTEIPGGEEIEREQFDRVVKQLNNDISNLNRQQLNHSHLPTLARVTLTTKPHLQPIRHLLTVDNVTILFMDTRGLTMHRSNVISVKMVPAQLVMTSVAQIALVHGTQQTSIRVIRVLATTSQLHYQHQILRPLFA